MSRITAAILVLLWVATACSEQNSQSSAPTLQSESGEISQPALRFEEANANRHYVMVAAHRGSWWHEGEIEVAENSIDAINRAIEIRADIVELDVRLTADDEFVLMHDPALDRTTNCEGLVSEKTYEAISACQLIVESTGKVTSVGIPTLREALRTAGNDILVNIDAKVPLGNLVRVIDIAVDEGLANQIILKAPVMSDEQVAEAVEIYRVAQQNGVYFMPKVSDAASNAPDWLRLAFVRFSPDAIEVTATYEEGAALSSDGGLFFSSEFLDLAADSDTHLWLNTIYHPVAGLRSGGRGDELAVLEGKPSEVWGFWAERGVTIFQTDEPKLAIDWLEKNGYRNDKPAEEGSRR